MKRLPFKECARILRTKSRGISVEISRAVDDLEVFDEKGPEIRKLGIVEGGLPANYVLVRTVIAQPDIRVRVPNDTGPLAP